MGIIQDDQDRLNANYKDWAAAANRRINTSKAGGIEQYNPIPYLQERAQNVAVRAAETAASPATEKGAEINTTKRRSDDLEAALKASHDATKAAPQFDSNAKLTGY